MSNLNNEVPELLSEVEALSNIESLRLLLVGYPKQFWVSQGEVFCLRATCDDCPHKSKCESEDNQEVELTLTPHSRKAVGFEDEPFNVLRFLEGQNWETFPKDLWNNGLDPLSDADERNIHYLT